MTFARYVEMLAEAGLRPWQRFGSSRMVNGDLPRLRWRVSPDERERVMSSVTWDDAEVRSGPMIDTLFGLWYFVDPALPPNSVVLEDLPE